MPWKSFGMPSERTSIDLGNIGFGDDIGLLFVQETHAGSAILQKSLSDVFRAFSQLRLEELV